MYSSIALWCDLHRSRNHRKSCGSERIGHAEGGISSVKAVKASLTKTAEADMLVYILDKLRTRMSVKARVFLLKVKTHRGEPLNERTDDLVDVWISLDKNGKDSQLEDRRTRLVYSSDYSYFEITLNQWKEDTWSKTICNVRGLVYIS
jgi:hypothetical protein